MLSTAWTREIEPPWRRGRGVAVRTGTRLRTVGLWFRGPAPEDEIVTLDVDAEVVRGYKEITFDKRQGRIEMLKLVLWPLAVAAALWKVYRWVKTAHVDWSAPFEQEASWN